MSSVLEQRKYKRLIDSYKESQQEILVSFCGRFKTGKSTLINRILGREILPTKITTATAVITRIEYGDKESAFIEKNGKRIQVSFDEAKKAILFDDNKDLKTNLQTTVIFKLPLPILKSGVVLVDTPGTDDYDILEEISLNQARKSSLCVIVFQALGFNGLAEKEFCKNVNENLGGNVVFVVNKCDLINSPEQFQHLLKQEDTTLKKFGNDFVGRGRVFNTSCDKDSPDFGGFDQWLSDVISSDKAIILKSIANSRRTDIIYNTLGEMLTEDIKAKERELEIIKKKQESFVAALIRDERVKVLSIRTELSEYKKYAFEMLRSTYGIDTALNELKKETGWNTNFSINSKNVILSILEKRFNELRTEFNTQFGKYLFKRKTEEIRFNFPYVDVQPLLSGINFPEADIIWGSSGSGVGMAVGIGVAAILSIFSFGAAAPLGVIAGKAAKDAATKPDIDNSTPTTTKFIELEVFPKVSVKIDQIFTDFNASLNKMESYGLTNSEYEKEINTIVNEISSLRCELVKIQERKLSI